MATGNAVENANPAPQPLVIARDDRLLPATIAVRAGLLTDARFTTVRKRTVSVLVGSNAWHEYKITPENPLVSQSARGKLDEQGLIRAGSVLEPGDVLVSVESQKLVAVTAKSKKTIVEDASTGVPPGWVGSTVEQVSTQIQGRGAKGQKDVCTEIEIILRMDCPLQLGDVLCAAGEPLGVIVETFADGGDDDSDIRINATSPVEFTPGKAEQVSKSEQLARDFVRVRRIGPYSLISETPLRHNATFITADHVQWLISHGCQNNCAELVSLKSDDVTNRPALKTMIDGGSILSEDVPAPAVPFGLQSAEALLWALGIRVERRNVDGFREWHVSPATCEELRSLSQGPIRKPETLNYRTLEPEPEGLFCERVFGPEKGKQLLFGHLEMPEPVVPYVWRLGSQSLMSRLTGLTSNQLDSVLSFTSDVVVNDGKFEIVPHDDGESPGVEGSSEHENLGTGVASVAAMLARLPHEHLPATWKHEATELIPDLMLVLPAKLRPIVLLDSGNFATSDLNDLYRRLINRRNRLFKLIELKAPDVICRNERRMLQAEADHLAANGLVNKRAKEGGRTLVDIITLLNQQLSPREKRVDWSGSARVVPDESIPSQTVLIPIEIVETLWLEPQTPVLLTTPHGSRFVAAFPQPGNDSLIRLPPDLYLALELGDLQIGEQVCDVHRPLGAAAIQEARNLLAAEQEPSREERPDQEPLDIEQILEAVWNGTGIRFDTGSLILLAGLDPSH